MRVSIVGTGYVGLVSGVGLASVGHDVTCVDVDVNKVAMINEGRAPIHEDGLDPLLARLIGKNLRATVDLERAVLDSDLTLIAVGTPFKDDAIDLQYIEAAAREIGNVLRRKPGYHVVVVKSTVTPGTTDSLVLPTLEQASGKRAGQDFGVGMNPEFLREGDALRDFMQPDRIVLGGIDARTQESLAVLYAPFVGVDVVRTSPRTAEMIKYAANSLLATLISFSNEIANLSAAIGVDALEVMRGVHLDKRFAPIQPDGSRVWPGSLTYLEGGCGFGGSCFPKDVKALIAFGREHGNAMDLLGSVIAVNEAQPHTMLRLLEGGIAKLAGSRISVLGMAFKPGTDDIRESPSLPVTEELLSAGAHVTVYDPIATDAVKTVFANRVSYARDLAHAVRDADGILIMTRWAEFANLPALIAGRERQPVVVDGRRMLAKESIGRYFGIGLGPISS